jgi:hypothetical protein
VVLWFLQDGCFPLDQMQRARLLLEKGKWGFGYQARLVDVCSTVLMTEKYQRPGELEWVWRDFCVSELDVFCVMSLNEWG